MATYEHQDNIALRVLEIVFVSIYSTLRLAVKACLAPAMIVAATCAAAIFYFGIDMMEVRHSLAYLLANTEPKEWVEAGHIIGYTYTVAAGAVMFYMFMSYSPVVHALGHFAEKLLAKPIGRANAKLDRFIERKLNSPTPGADSRVVPIKVIATMCGLIFLLSLVSLLHKPVQHKPNSLLLQQNLQKLEAARTPINQSMAVVMMPDGTLHTGKAKIEEQDGKYIISFDRPKH